MSDLISAVFAAALSLPAPWYPPGKNPETTTEYQARVRVISEAVATEARAAKGWGWGSRSLAFAALTILYNESRFSLPVHSGDQLGDRGRARCLGQIHASGLIPKPEWEKLTGTDLDSTRRCVRATMRLLVAQHRWCAVHRKPLTTDNMARVFAAYGSGGRCGVTGSARERARQWTRLANN